ncbi:MAG: GAF domain-containing protein [Hyphomicrobium sp.]
MRTLRQIWHAWRVPHGAVWLPVLPPLGAFAELAALIGLIQIVNAAFPGLEITDIEPSPYWLPILLLSLQYGTVAGLLAAGTATLVYVFSGLPEQVIDEHHFAYLLRAWVLPILWIAVALVLGQFRLRQIERKQTLVDDLDRRTREAEGLAGYAGDLERRCRQLERQLTSSGQGRGAGVLDAIALLQSSNADLPRAFERICSAGFPGAGLTVYAVQPSGLEPGFSTMKIAPSGKLAQQDRAIPAGHPLYTAVVGERRAVSVLNAAEEALLAGQGLAAVPVVHAETGRVIGLVKLEQGDGAILTNAITDQLSVVARLIAPLLFEPRIVVDNTERAVSSSDGVSHRLTRGWRQFSWQVQPAGEGPQTGVHPAGSAKSSDDGRGTPRPRQLK